MAELLFITGNERKKGEMRHVAPQYGVSIVFKDNPAEEIQHTDPAEVTKAKARDIYTHMNMPLVVQDTSWSIPALGGFPGAYMKDVARWLTVEDWLHLMSRHDDKTIIKHEHVAYHDGSDIHHFSCSYSGRFITTPRGVGVGFSNDPIVLMDGSSVTLAERLDNNMASELGDAGLQHWHDFMQWYTSDRNNS